jgi:hypothetical protein
VIYASFPIGSLNQPYRPFRLGPLEFLPQTGYISFPKRERWPYREILEFVAADGACMEGNRKRPSLGMVVDISEFNRNAMLYEAAKSRYPVNVYWGPIGGRSDSRYDLESALAIASQQDYLVFRSMPTQESDFTNRFNEQIRQKIEGRQLLFQVANVFPLPDGTKALLYRRGLKPT